MARLRRMHAKHLVFGLGMLALAVGVSVSLWMLLARDRPGPAAGSGTASLSQAFQDTLGLTPAEAEDLAAKLQGPRQVGTPGDDAPLSQVLEQTLGLTPQEAATLAAQLQEAVAKARAATPTEENPLPASGRGQEPALSETKGERAPAAAPSGGGMSDKAGIGDQVQFEIRDASGKIKR